MAEDKIDKMVITVVAAVIGIVMICSFAIPTIYTQVSGITNAEALADYGDLLRMTCMFLIVGLILFIVRSYNNAGR